jgi:hypothetical protein
LLHGKKRSIVQEVTVRAGEEIQVNLALPTIAVAER